MIRCLTIGTTTVQDTTDALLPLLAALPDNLIPRTSTMTEQENWKWWVGHDEERYHTECDTKDEAAYIASEEYDGGYIVEAMKPDNIKISRYFDAHMFVENAEDSAYDDYGDAEGVVATFPVKPELRNDLEIMVRAAMDAWQEKHGLTFTGFAFAASRNHEYIPAKCEAAAPE